MIIFIRFYVSIKYLLLKLKIPFLTPQIGEYYWDLRLQKSETPQKQKVTNQYFTPLYYFIPLYFNWILIKTTTLTVNIKDISQITIIKKILKAFNVEVIEQNNEITNPEIIQRLEKHYKNFQNPAYREENYTKIDTKNIWA